MHCKDGEFWDFLNHTGQIWSTRCCECLNQVRCGGVWVALHRSSLHQRGNMIDFVGIRVLKHPGHKQDFWETLCIGDILYLFGRVAKSLAIFNKIRNGIWHGENVNTLWSRGSSSIVAWSASNSFSVFRMSIYFVCCVKVQAAMVPLFQQVVWLSLGNEDFG